MTTLQKLYLELANVVPLECYTSRELALRKKFDQYGLALMMIANGCADPRSVAREALEKAKA